MTKVYLGIGSNMGDRVSYIEKAIKEISNTKGITVLKSSLIYETEPWGIKDQGDYLNCVLGINTELEAEVLMKSLKKIENKLGRTENSKWSEREIDIDLLFYGNEIIRNENMTVPHSEIEKRNFVLIPMEEISPDFIHPVFKKSISKLLAETSDNLRVKRFIYRNEDK